MLNLDPRKRPTPAELIDLIDHTFPRVRNFNPNFIFKKVVTKSKKTNPTEDLNPLQAKFHQV